MTSNFLLSFNRSYTFSPNFVLVRRLVRRLDRHSAKRGGGSFSVGGSSLERRWKLVAEAGCLGFVIMHDGVFKQRA